MSTPPPGDGTPESWPSHETPPVPPPPPPGHGYGPPQGYPPPGYPPYGHPAPPPSPPRRISIPMVFVGPLIYVVLNMVIGFLAFVVAGSTTTQASNTVFGITAVVLALIAFGGGAALLAVRSPYARGIGLGLMIGWALTSVLTVGLCTGLNPDLYTL